MGNVWTKIEENLPTCLDADAIFPEWNGSFPYRDEDQKADDELTLDTSSDSDGSTYSGSDSQDDDATEDSDSTTSLHSTSAVMVEDGGPEMTPRDVSPVGNSTPSLVRRLNKPAAFVCNEVNESDV
ncbi:hypothetical protein WR25_06906 [Diploscapter pachys]|uniref:Uncharacterized protein n=1 Tax=Diploscapter pachys TaxID=2018661 RepID=A0A2A2L3T0_9BILA|nr:hypothetical protein WR25_06906 [Diploscapter pachys]